MAHEKVTLYGAPIVADRVVGYGRIDREAARDIFIQHALIGGDWRTRHHFFRDNQALIKELEELEAKTRRRDLLVSDEQVFRFYDERIPKKVVRSEERRVGKESRARVGPRHEAKMNGP